MTPGHWREVKRNEPCPVCGKPDWCGRSDDGAIRCMRIADPPPGWRRLKTCPDGGTVFRPADESSYTAPAPQNRPRAARGRRSRTLPTANSAAANILRMIQQEHGADWVQVATFIYSDGLGREVARVLRYEPPDRGPRKLKQLRPIHCVGGSWSIGDPAGQWPLYRLAELIGSQRVFILEGEGKADALRSLGLIATTSAHGSKAAAKTDWRPMGGKECIILPDEDADGRHYAEAVASILHRLHPPTTVRILNLPDLPHSGDIIDFIEDRRTDAKDALAIRTEISDLAALLPEHVPSAGDDQGDGPRPVVVRLSDVQPEPVRWLWPGRIPRGKLTLLVGDPGLGKSLQALDMAARVSTGTLWPDALDVPNPAGGVVLLSAEDDLADTIRPRLDAAGAEVSRIIALEAVVQRNPQTGAAMRTPFCLATDLPALESAIEQVGDCRLVVIDPITAYLGATDSHKNAELRGLLHPLADLARRHRVAVVAVTHLRKAGGPAMYRAMGSLAFVAAARAVWAVTKDKDNPRRRLVLPVKNNLAADVMGMAYTIEAIGPCDAPVVAWEPDPVELSADDALAAEQGGTEDGDDAKGWLREALADGEMPAADVLRQARTNGFTDKATRKAFKAIRGERRRDGFGPGGVWYWRLADTIGAPIDAIGSHSEGTGNNGNNGDAANDWGEL